MESNSALFLYSRKEETLIINSFYLNLDFKRLYNSEKPTFRRGDNVELTFTFYDDGDEFSIGSATKAEVHQITKNKNKIVTECDFVMHKGKRAVRWKVEDVSMTELGYLTLSVLVYEGDKVISIQPFNVLILDDYMGGASSFIELIQELERLIDNMKLDLNNAVKVSEKGKPNGVASLDELGKIPIEQMPQEFQGFLDHIKHTVWEHRVHGIGLDDDEQLMYQDNNGDWQYIGFSPSGVGGGATQTVSASISVVNSISTVTYSGIPRVVLSKWEYGDKPISHFALSGNTFTGNTFPVSNIGIHTLYYKDSNGLEYVKTFNVTMSMIARPNVTITVDDGYATVTIPPNVVASIKKWAKGNQSVSYFAYNGTTFTGNTFKVTEVGTYSVYIKTVTGLEYVYTFEVTESMLGATLNNINVGETFSFGNKTFVLLEKDVTLGNLVMDISSKPSKKYDTNAGNNAEQFNINRVSNIGYYLNNEYLNTFNQSDLSSIYNSSWGTGEIRTNEYNPAFLGFGAFPPTSTISELRNRENSRTVNCKVSILSLSEYRKFSKHFKDNGLMKSGDEQSYVGTLDFTNLNINSARSFLRTPFSSSDMSNNTTSYNDTYKPMTIIDRNANSSIKERVNWLHVDGKYTLSSATSDLTILPIMRLSNNAKVTKLN